MKIVISMVKLTTSAKSKHLNHRVRIWMWTVYSDFTLNFESHFFRFFSVFYSWEEHLNYHFYIVIIFLQIFLAVMQHSKPRNTDPDQHTNFFFKILNHFVGFIYSVLCLRMSELGLQGEADTILRGIWLKSNFVLPIK